MRYMVYSVPRPDGVERDENFVSGEIITAIEQTGVYRGRCPCCSKRIVVRAAGERTAMTAGDEHFLLHEEELPQ